MSSTALMTFAEFEQLPDAPGKQELIDGELITMPPPELRHSTLVKRLFGLLLRHLPESRVWPDRTGYRILDGWIEPDVSVSWPDQRRDEKYFLGSPMIAIEILSPGEEIERKLTLYFAEGAAEVWVIDGKTTRHDCLYAAAGRSRAPADRGAISLRRGAGGVHLAGGGVRLRFALLDLPAEAGSRRRRAPGGRPPPP
jgi:hypothetical protein